MLKHIMIDLEMNKIKKQYRDDKKLANELIEIGAVKMDDDFNEVDRYQSYVMPDYGKMDSHIIKLTYCSCQSYIYEQHLNLLILYFIV